MYGASRQKVERLFYYRRYLENSCGEALTLSVRYRSLVCTPGVLRPGGGIAVCINEYDRG